MIQLEWFSYNTGKTYKWKKKDNLKGYVSVSLSCEICTSEKQKNAARSNCSATQPVTTLLPTNMDDTLGSQYSETLLYTQNIAPLTFLQIKTKQFQQRQQQTPPMWCQRPWELRSAMGAQDDKTRKHLLLLTAHNRQHQQHKHTAGNTQTSA